jgi:hypothetical protein
VVDDGAAGQRVAAARSAATGLQVKYRHIKQAPIEFAPPDWVT